MDKNQEAYYEDIDAPAPSSAPGEDQAHRADLNPDTVIAMLQDVFKTATDYIEENPREATAIAIAAGLTGWMLLATKPGRKIFDFGVAAFALEISKWMSRKFGPVLH
jgi:hypothetical protein